MNLTFPPLQHIPSFDAGLQGFLRIVDESKECCICTHINSDGDSLGSQLGLKFLLEQRGTKVWCVNPSHVPENLRFLPESASIQVFEESRHTELLAKVDTIFVLDGNSPARMRGMEAAIMASPARKAVLDHHQEPVEFAHAYAIDTDACSTAELVFRLLRVLETREGAKYLTKNIAEALYTGIMTDTGNFRFPRTDSDVHRIIAEFLDAGVEPFTVYDNVFNQNPMKRARLLGVMLKTMHTHHNDKLCIMQVTQEMMEALDVNVDHLEGFVEQTLTIQGVEMGALVVELPDQVKMSLRSKGTIPVNKMAAHFGGGGHINAAGCRSTTHSAAEAVQEIIRISAQYLQKA